MNQSVQSLFSANGNMKDRVCALELQADLKNKNDLEAVTKIEALNEKSVKLNKQIQNLVVDMKKKFQTLNHDITRQNDHRFSLQESEIKRSENQLLALKSDQNDMIWTLPDFISRVSSLESEMGIKWDSSMEEIPGVSRRPAPL